VASSALAACGLLAWVGCGGDTAGPPTADEVAVFAFLYVGEPVSAANAVRVSRVQPVDATYDPVQAAVENAVVTLTAEGGAAETLEAAAPGAYADSTVVIAPRTTYHLRVEIPGERVLTATTTTPPAVRIDGGPPQLPDSVRHEVLQDEYPVYVTCDDPEQILLSDVYCLEDWRTARFIYPIGPDDTPQSYDEYGGDDDEPRHIFAYFRAGDVVQDDGGRYLVDFYGAMMAFYGRYTVHVSAIDRNTYDSLYKDHPEENGGIVGGIGVFGSACRRTWSVQATP
jgi:hypothetical protein